MPDINNLKEKIYFGSVSEGSDHASFNYVLEQHIMAPGACGRGGSSPND
jgi:hypothetical protein